jgi:predicted  nucleic acid-binding Zn-ribbon protein
MLNIIKLKGCKKCGGDLFLEKDVDGSYVSCLQCGAMYVRNVIPPFRRIRERKILAHSAK